MALFNNGSGATNSNNLFSGLTNKNNTVNNTVKSTNAIKTSGLSNLANTILNNNKSTTPIKTTTTASPINPYKTPSISTDNDIFTVNNGLGRSTLNYGNAASNKDRQNIRGTLTQSKNEDGSINLTHKGVDGKTLTSYDYYGYKTPSGDTYLSTGTPDTNVQDPINYGGSGGSSSSYYDDLMAAFMEQNEAARQAALEAILQNLNAVKGTYKNQIEKVINDYNALVDENEVKKDRARRVIRENQANRGQLDSGMGRQEQLDMNIGYDNATTQLKSAREQAVNEIYNLIAQAEAEANTNRANVNNTYNNALLEYQMAVRS